MYKRQAGPSAAGMVMDASGGWPMSSDDLVQALTLPALAGFWQACAGHTLWWADGGRRLRRVRGMPASMEFHTLLARVT